MRRKLIKRDAFEQIAGSSVSTAQHELAEAENILARALGKDHLRLHSFNESTVLFETLDDTYVHAGFEMKNGKLTFNNIEELVIDEESQKNKRRSFLGEMLDSVITDNKEKADTAFENYMQLFSWNETKKNFFTQSNKKGNPFAKGKKGDKEEGDDKPSFMKKAKEAGKKVAEAYMVATDVLDYVKYMQVGPALAESVVKRDGTGNVVDLMVPSSKLRNESKVQQGDWAVLRDRVRNFRKEALSLATEQSFCKAMVELRSQNNISNAEGLESCLAGIVKNHPCVLYVTESELAEIIAEALNTMGVTKYDDQQCKFMAEGVLLTAFETYADRVNQVLKLANATVEEGTNAYSQFQGVVENFYSDVDQKFGLQRKVFADLYECIEGIYRSADRRSDEALKQVTAGYLNELADVLNEKVKADLELAEEAASWMKSFIETCLTGEEWTVSNKTHLTVSGDHPQMAKNAKEDGIPSKYKGDWGDEAPMIGQDSMAYKGGKHSKQARNNSWSQEGSGGDVFPGLKNPYQLKAFGDFTMKGEKGIDKDAKGQHGATWESGDTFPRLKNPYVPHAETNKTYKMNKGKEKDLVVDK
jgi:hypothetical protein